ncbi:MAG TPA: amylo-alpha-1,6-glucosidase, partial [Lacunisphaera sp.]|nr:amylo-alpha-1,6-glucosidase [Lacunisphaera sp.]
MRRIDLDCRAGPEEAAHCLRKQWLVTNGLGGYASGTIAGAVTWRYHGLLIAALPPPAGRTMMLNHLIEALRLPDGRDFQFGGEEPTQVGESPTSLHLREFRLENQIPCWRYQVENVVFEKRVLMPHLQNTVQVTYRLLEGPDNCRLHLRPSVHFRPFEGDVDAALHDDYEIRARGQQFEIFSADAPAPLRLHLHAENTLFLHDSGSVRQIYYQRDEERGYPCRGELWSPGFFSTSLRATAPTTLVASTETWSTLAALGPDTAYEIETSRRRRLLRIAHPAVREGVAAELVLAADQFIIEPVGRVTATAHTKAAGDELRSVIAGYHWFTDWGRDTMISLEGLTVATGRLNEAKWILRTFAHYARDGLIPNLFPEGRTEGLYHTADASLWFFHALHRFYETSNSRETLRALLPVLRDVIAHHLKGTKFGIGVDPADGLLRQGAPGYQLTWMDAKVGDWVVTPRRGKPVEINALWYNALRLLEGWMRTTDQTAFADELGRHASRAQASFNARFWNETKGCLYDVVDGEKGRTDDAVRPNQILALALPHPVLAPERWEPVLRIVQEKLLTPLGLRSLSPDHPDYKVKYSGDLRARDAAYHQGTVWAWLIGPFIDAWLKVHPDDGQQAQQFLMGFVTHLGEACMGSIS